jgi:L-lysine 6-transaminase
MRAFSLPSGVQRDALIGKLWDRRVMMLASGSDSVRFRPALTVSYREIDEGVATVRDALR